MKKISENLAQNRAYFLLTLLVGILFSGMSVLTPVISGNMVNAFTKEVSAGERYLLLYLLAGLSQILLSMLDSYMGLQLQIRQKKWMRRNVFSAFLKKEFAGREEISEFVSFVNNDIPALTEQYIMGTIDIIKCVFILFFSGISMLSVHWALALIVFLSSGLMILCPKIMRKKGGEVRLAYSEALGRYNTQLHSFLDGLRIVKSYNYRRRVGEIMESTNEETAKKEHALICCQMYVQGLTSFLQVGKTLLILIAGVILISMGQMEIGGLITVVQLAQVIAAPAEVLAYMIHARNEVLPLLEEYEQMTAGGDEKDDCTLCNDRIETITVSDVSYETNGLQILQGVAAVFEAGKKYLISGESGSGKSTLMKLLSGSKDCDYTGRITYNGKDIKEISVESYCKKIAPVFQEPYLFYATLEENILLGRSVSKEAYGTIIKKLNLQYLLERYKGQEITPEILEQLSGGERQRVTLARAMVGNPEVYLLDEVTSALDSTNAFNIEEMLLKEEAMVIHICHKSNPKLCSLYDEQLVMQNGRISVR